MVFKKFFSIILAIAIFTGFIACSEDSDNTAELEGSVKFEITDSPIDDTSVKGAFVTISDIKVDGKSVEGFNKTTLDLLAYQNGDTKLLTNSELNADMYNELILVLDYNEDADGNSPGCYITENGSNTKHPLYSTSNEIELQYDLEVEAESQTDLVIDFDLRKCVKRERNGSDQFDFVSQTELENGLRVVNKNEVGVIMGNCTDLISESDKIVVYAYKQGTFNRDTEMNGQGQSEVELANAITSSTVDANGNFELHFLEAGAYELHYCSYEENMQGQMELQGTLTVDVMGSLNLEFIQLDASGSVDLDVVITGMLPL